MRAVRFAYVVAGVVLLADAGSAQALRGSDVLQNVERTMGNIEDYTVQLQIEVDMERLRIPKMVATLYFKRPDKIHFESANFAMIPREGIALNPSRLRQLYNVTNVGEEDLEGKKSFKLQLAAKNSAARIREMYLWADPTNWTIVKMQTVPFSGRTLTISFAYALHEERYWVPQTLIARFELAGPDTASVSIDPFGSAMPRQSEMRGPLRHGSVNIVYSNYRVNSGLPDSIFEKPSVE